MLDYCWLLRPRVTIRVGMFSYPRVRSDRTELDSQGVVSSAEPTAHCRFLDPVAAVREGYNFGNKDFLGSSHTPLANFVGKEQEE